MEAAGRSYPETAMADVEIVFSVSKSSEGGYEAKAPSRLTGQWVVLLSYLW